ncbi:DeoR/GlpR family transcriptional regulator of sugar metabolism [Filimonas zeae]|uniref:DeoR family transcriptional regulator n=1 Tax=Filimonas zeae TaxID=1737353 RepID=A0A917J2Q2_9BACT|nr:DeoR/GlpR family DNA-binding transcription regulator [Filimonas zeae]MDR6341542.1 DeoR/GlpR family transcriptional regulator of sugar metabolism [Filimonas zeae]GGH75352.1 DeoR family transcriptional regulator [Filimonas zeae]
MLKEERLDFILRKLKTDQKVTLGELSAMLQVSEYTVRRDIELLAENNLLTKVRGGAVPHSPNMHPFTDRVHVLEDDKKKIARKALQLLQPGQTVLMSGGTTTYTLARMLPQDMPLTVVTNNVPLATILCEHPLVEVLLAGGRIDKHAQMTTGADAARMFQQVHVDICFTGICSLHHEIGVSTHNYDDLEAGRAMLQAASKVVAVTTLDKIGTAELYKMCDISVVDCIITEADNTHQQFQPYTALGIQIL